MPQASEDLRAEFGIDDRPVIRFLEAAGYTRTDDWCWLLPEGKIEPTEKEDRAILFLIEEWDWGGWVMRAEAPEGRAAIGQGEGAPDV